MEGSRGELPSYTRTLDRCWSELDNSKATPALSEDDRHLLTAHYLRLRQQIEATPSRWVPLHGDVHLGKLLVGGHGPSWTHFEDACLGPAEQDIVGLPSSVWVKFTNADLDLVKRFNDLTSVCVAVWCSAETSRTVEVAEAADYHLRRFRRLAF